MNAFSPDSAIGEHSDAELIDLGRQYQEMLDEWNAALVGATDEVSDAAHEKYDGPLETIETAIIGLPAHSWAGLLAKLRIATSDAKGDQRGSDIGALWSAYDDAERLAGASS